MEDTSTVSVDTNMGKGKNQLDCFRGETCFIKVSRGLTATGLILVVVFYSVVNIILYPIQEIGLIPTNNLRSVEIPQYLQAATPVWNVVFVSIAHFI